MNLFGNARKHRKGNFCLRAKSCICLDMHVIEVLASFELRANPRPQHPNARNQTNPNQTNPNQTKQIQSNPILI